MHTNQEQAREKRKGHFGKLSGHMGVILKRIFNNQRVRCGLQWSDSGQGAGVGCIEHDNEATGCTKVDNF